MELKAGYKQTEVGVIPEDWEIISLGDSCEKIQDGNYGGDYPKSNEFLNYGIPFLTSKAIGKDGFLKEDLINFISLQKHVKLSKAHIELNDVLFTNRGGSVGAIGFVDSRTAGGNIGPQLTLLRANSDVITPRYLLHSMKSFAVQKQMQSQDSGSAMNFFGITATNKFKFTIPPTKAEQEAIAEALSDTDALIESLEQLITKKRHIKQGAMQELLTGNKRLPGFNGEWEVKRLGDIASLYQPITISAHQFTSAGYPVYGANGVVGFFDNFNHDSWQVTVTCRGSTCGTVNRTVEKCWITGNAMVVNCEDSKEIDKSFLYYRLTFQDLSICITGTGQPQIVRTPLANFELNIPSEVSEQTAIATILSDMDNEIATLETQLTKTRSLKKGMMHNLLTGKIRLL